MATKKKKSAAKSGSENKKQAPPVQMESFREEHSRNLIDWTPARIKMAFAAAEGGNLRQAANICDLMLTDDRVIGVMGALTSVVSLPISFDPVDSPAGLALSGEGDRKNSGDWWQIFPEPELHELIRWGQMLGVGLARIKGWKYSKESLNLIPEIDVWHPRNLRWDSIKDKWYARVQGGGEVEVTPGDGEWILYTPFGKKRPWSKAPWRGISDWWLLKKYAKHDWANHSERLGNGIRVIEEEAASQMGTPLNDNDDTSKANRKELSDNIRNQGRNATIVLPPGFTFKLVESIARNFESFRAQNDTANIAIAIALVGQNLTSEVGSGSLASSKVHERVEARRIRNVAETVATLAHDQVFPIYIQYNFADDSSVWLIFDTAPPEDKQVVAEAQLNFSKMLSEMTKTGWDVDNADEVGARLGMKLVRKLKPKGKDDNESTD